MTCALELALEPIQSVDHLEREWRAIEAAGRTSFFTSWLWIGTWLSVLPPQVQPLLLRAQLGGRTVALAVLVRRKTRRHGLFSARQIHFNATGDPRFDCCFIEHNGFAAAGIDHKRLWRAFVSWFESGAATVDEILINGMTDCPDIAASGLAHRVQYLPAYAVDLAPITESGSDPTARLSRNSRQQLRRAMRLCSQSGALEIDPARDTQEALTFFAAMKPLHIAHWVRRGKPHAFVNPHFEIFHQSLIASGFPNGAIDLLRVRAGSRVLGYVYNLRHAGTVYAYQSGFGAFDPHWRVGYISHALAIRHAALRGDIRYDFMAGSNRLKRSFASTEYQIGWHVLQRQKVSFRIEHYLREVRAALSVMSRRSNIVDFGVRLAYTTDEEEF